VLRPDPIRPVTVPDRVKEAFETILVAGGVTVMEGVALVTVTVVVTVFGTYTESPA
jgi:hypothetical protein